jgi:two-component system, NtrC family, C4-dicarboxylate transport response regulator DctD
MSGYDLAEHLRAREPNLPVVLMSGYAEPPLATGSLAAGKTGYIQKPFQVDILVERLREVLEGNAG